MKRYSILLLVMTVAVMPLSAQQYFTGSFSAVITSVEDGELNTIQVVASPERLLLSGLGEVVAAVPASMPGMSAERLLIRMDQQDMVFLSGEPTALRMQMQEITAAMNLMAGMNRQSQNSQQDLVEVRETRETQRINGFTARKWEIHSKENDNAVHVWISEDFRVNLAMFASVWKMMTTNESLSGIADMLQGGQTPLLVELLNGDGKVQYRAEMTDIRRGVDAGVFEVPDGVRLMTLQDMILNQMRQQ